MSFSEARSNGQKKIVIALRTGRLANRLILFANFIAFVEQHKHRLVNVAFHSYAHLFEATRRDIYCQYPAPARRSWFDVLPGAAPLIRKTRIFYQLTRAAAVANGHFHPFGKQLMTLSEIQGRDVTLLEDPEIQNQIAGAKTVLAYGWRFRAPDAVQKHAEKIRAYFRPVEHIARGCQETMHRLRQRADIVVGVHVRRGDYRGWKGGNFFFDVARYAVWMREMAGQFPGRRVVFFVSSDEPRRPAEFEDLPVEIGGGPAVNDLYTLARCDYVFGPPSTFSQWASFYGKVPLLHLRGNDGHAEAGKFRVSLFENVL